MKLRAPDKASPLLVPTAYANAVQRQLEIQPHRFGVRVDSKSECKSEYPPKYVGSVARWGILNKKPAAPSVARPHFPTNPNDYYDSAFVGNRTTSGALLGHPQKRYIDPSRVPYLPPEDPPVGPGKSYFVNWNQLNIVYLSISHTQITLSIDNPSKQLDAIWYAYWDEVASAVYYYNHETGEVRIAYISICLRIYITI